MSGSRRRRFINGVNSLLTRALNVNDQDDYSDHEVRQSEDIHYVPTPQELLDQEREQYFRVHRQIQELRRLVTIVPRGIRRRLMESETMNRIKEILDNTRLEDLPGDLLEVLNDLNIF